MGGSHISALKLIGALDRKKYRPLIVLHDDRGQFADFLRAEGVAFEHAPTPWHLAPASRAETIGKMMGAPRSEEHTSELQSLMRISYAVFCLKKKKNKQT